MKYFRICLPIIIGVSFGFYQFFGRPVQTVDLKTITITVKQVHLQHSIKPKSITPGSPYLVISAEEYPCDFEISPHHYLKLNASITDRFDEVQSATGDMILQEHARKKLERNLNYTEEQLALMEKAGWDTRIIRAQREAAKNSPPVNTNTESRELPKMKATVSVDKHADLTTSGSVQIYSFSSDGVDYFTAD